MKTYTEGMRKVRTVGCFIEYEGKFVILHRQTDRPQGDTWCLVSGKVEPGETDEQAVLREIWEETGFRAKPADLEFLGKHVFRFPEVEITFPTFRIQLSRHLDIRHNPREHQTFRWVTPEECYAMPNLIHGLHDLLERIGYIKAPSKL